MVTEVSLEDRQRAQQEADAVLSDVAQTWIDAHIKGEMSRELDDSLTQAIHEFKKAERRLRDTEKRLAK